VKFLEGGGRTAHPRPPRRQARQGVTLVGLALAGAVKARARELGFDRVAVGPAGPPNTAPPSSAGSRPATRDDGLPRAWAPGPARSRPALARVSIRRCRRARVRARDDDTRAGRPSHGTRGGATTTTFMRPRLVELGSTSPGGRRRRPDAARPSTRARCSSATWRHAPGSAGSARTPTCRRGARLLVLHRRRAHDRRARVGRARARPVRHLYRVSRRVPDAGVRRPVRARRAAVHRVPTIEHRGDISRRTGKPSGVGVRVRRVSGGVPLEPEGRACREPALAPGAPSRRSRRCSISRGRLPRPLPRECPHAHEARRPLRTPRSSSEPVATGTPVPALRRALCDADPRGRRAAQWGARPDRGATPDEGEAARTTSAWNRRRPARAERFYTEVLGMTVRMRRRTKLLSATATAAVPFSSSPTANRAG